MATASFLQAGISIYPGLGNRLEENLQLIEDAARQGITQMFTSFHIPETDRDAFRAELGEILQAARQHDMEIISDISPSTMELLGMERFDLSAFRRMGIRTLRLDDGYGAEEIARLSRNDQGMKIQLNASTITDKLVLALRRENADFRNISALHNFYPRENTGLEWDTLMRKTILLHAFGISVGAFVPSRHRRRPPLRRGLPTLEIHRDLPLDLTARHLAALGIDTIFVGDSLPSGEELQVLGRIPGGQVTLRAALRTENEAQKQLLGHVFTARADAARDAVRAQESRGLLREMGAVLPAENNQPRSRGAVTIDNRDYGRYMGELQIIKREQPADPRVNVAAMIDEKEHFLIDLIFPEKKFGFVLW